jgi:hypothetical protein
MVGATYAAAAVARTAKTVTANGNAQVSTAQNKFGGASALFDGNGDYLTFDSSSADFTFGTSSWTAEMYVRFDDVGANYELFFDMRPFGSPSAATVCLYEYNGVLYYYSQGGDRISGGTVVANTWYHIAISRSGNDHKLFLDGTQIGSTYTNTNNITSVNANSVIGGISANNLGDSTLIFKGYMDEIRISNLARYTTTFTPTTAAFTNDVNTLLLIHCDGTNASTTFTDDTSHDLNFTAPTAAFSSDADTVVLYHLDNALTDSSSNAYTLNTSGGYSSSVVKFGTYSGNLSDSTSDYFAHTTDRYFAPYNGTARTNLTWECWAYYTSWSGASFNHASQNNPHPTLMCAGDQAGNRQSLKFGFSGSEGPYAEGLLCAVAGDNTNGNIDTFTIKGTTSFSLNTWYHVALTFNASTGAVKGYVDGVLQFSGTKSDLGFTLGTHLTLGAMQSNNSACYVDEVRISRTLRYGT